MGVWAWMRDALSVEERQRRAAPAAVIAPPAAQPKPQREAAQSGKCGQCRHWVPPSQVTAAIAPKPGQVKWAQENSFGRCTITGPRSETDHARFTPSTDGCRDFKRG